MRAVVFLAIVAVAFGNLCKGIEQEDINAEFSIARMVVTAILGGSCTSFDIDAVAFDGECKKLVEQVTCYGIKAQDHYDVEVVNYKLLKKDVENLVKLGNIACAMTRACIYQVKDAIQTCLDENEDFVDETIKAAEQFYRDNLEDDVTGFLAEYNESIFGDVLSTVIRIRVLHQFTSAHDILLSDIMTFIEELITEGEREDVRIAAEEIKRFTQEFCDSGCTLKTAQFLRKIFKSLHGGQCVDASKFCGDCQNRAEKWFKRSKNRLPCCIAEVVQKGIEAYNYVFERYDEVFDLLTSVLWKQPSNCAVKLEDAVAIKELEAEFSCVSEIYTSNRNKCK